ncbi:hypothetical protein AJ88_24480 [Mesorhizobium amorphae CCBAU 01583]|nr:hypothetical protein AJ88_24480 [Mesorhizobium amorphae CCBAU 01583]
MATPIEQEINGVEGMLYMSSYSSGDGAMALTITFKLGTDLDQAQVLCRTACRSPSRACPKKSVALASPPPRARPT